MHVLLGEDEKTVTFLLKGLTENDIFVDAVNQYNQACIRLEYLLGD